VDPLTLFWLIIWAACKRLEPFDKLLLPVLWDFVTNFLMPAAAILTSGYVAVRVQKKEHQTQARLRQQEIERAETQRITTERRALIIKATADNDLWLTHLRLPSPAALNALIPAQANSYHEWDLSDVPDASIVGYWLTLKREIVSKVAMGDNPTANGAVGIATGYFVDVSKKLKDWDRGKRSRKWFTEDIKRLRRDEPTLFEDHELQQVERRRQSSNK
jgi:hypothetical protein